MAWDISYKANGTWIFFLQELLIWVLNLVHFRKMVFSFLFFHLKSNAFVAMCKFNRFKSVQKIQTWPKFEQIQNKMQLNSKATLRKSNQSRSNNKQLNSFLCISIKCSLWFSVEKSVKQIWAWKEFNETALFVYFKFDVDEFYNAHIGDMCNKNNCHWTSYCSFDNCCFEWIKGH